MALPDPTLGRVSSEGYNAKSQALRDLGNTFNTMSDRTLSVIREWQDRDAKRIEAEKERMAKWQLEIDKLNTSHTNTMELEGSKQTHQSAENMLDRASKEGIADKQAQATRHSADQHYKGVQETVTGQIKGKQMLINQDLIRISKTSPDLFLKDQQTGNMKVDQYGIPVVNPDKWPQLQQLINGNVSDPNNPNPSNDPQNTNPQNGPKLPMAQH